MIPRAGSSAKRYDTVARWIITAGGLAVIGSVIAILVLIVGVTAPLFRKARCVLICRAALPEPIRGEAVVALGVGTGVDQGAMTAFVWTRDGVVHLVDARTGKLLKQQRVDRPAPGQAGLHSVEPLGAGVYSMMWSDGWTVLVEIGSSPSHPHGQRRAAVAVRTVASLPPSAGPPPRLALVRRSSEGAVTRVALRHDHRLSILRQVTSENLLGETETKASETLLTEDFAADIRAMTLDAQGATLYAGTKDGRLLRWQFDQNGALVRREVTRVFGRQQAVTALAMVLGDVSLAVGTAGGELSTWATVRADDTRKLRCIHRLRDHQGPVRAIVPSSRDKSLLSLGDDGTVHLDYTTSERHLLSMSPEPGRPIRHVALGQRGDLLLTLDAAGTLSAWSLDAGHGAISLKTLFGKVFYEGYDAPEYVWQTTGGDDFEPKFSLVPLIFGTLKGTFYAMLLAVPLALLGAVYTSYFTTPGIRSTLKPIVEIMAAVPSVVIGFLVALWLAPILSRWLLAFFVSLIALPATLIGFLLFWQLVRRHEWAKRVERGFEFLALVPVLLAALGLSVGIAERLEPAWFGGNFKLWLFSGPLGMPYDQRNSIIIAFGLGFTVIPVIFSIAEDSLSSVPHSITAASLALGASRWQTLWRVVLPSASPGIFAATMIGFGRAVGETMIVLMATGNTPILDWSPLNGMRTLSANIAVEIPEAPVGGTLYRVLFLCAILLFLTTCAANSAAELVRQRLRKRYGRF